LIDFLAPRTRQTDRRNRHPNAQMRSPSAAPSKK
jgi:hypothetical protein